VSRLGYLKELLFTIIHIALNILIRLLLNKIGINYDCLGPEEKETSQTVNEHVDTVNDHISTVNDHISTVNDHISTLLTNEKADEDDS
jgi:hypothetical protein